MALEAGGRKYCMVVHHENGRTWRRRVHFLSIQAADGRLHHLEGSKLPDSMTFHSGAAYRGAHLGEIMLNAENVKASLALPTDGWVSKRDAFFLLVGMFVFGLIFFLSEHTAIALS